MHQYDTGILPVVQDSPDLKLVRVVTGHDLCLTVVAARRDPAHTVVNECMSRNPVSVSPEDNVERVAGLMGEHRLRPATHPQAEIRPDSLPSRLPTGNTSWHDRRAVSRTCSQPVWMWYRY